MKIRRAFTAFQLMTILEEARHSLILIEHDLFCTSTPWKMPEYISKSMRYAAE
jgi:hypothetical protein